MCDFGLSGDLILGLAPPAPFASTAMTAAEATQLIGTTLALVHQGLQNLQAQSLAGQLTAEMG